MSVSAGSLSRCLHLSGSGDQRPLQGNGDQGFCPCEAGPCEGRGTGQNRHERVRRIDRTDSVMGDEHQPNSCPCVRPLPRGWFGFSGPPGL